MKKKKSSLRKIAILIIALLIIGFASRIIYADETEKISIVCAEENMFNALKNSLNKYIVLPTDVDKSTLTIKIPTAKISEITELNLEDKKIGKINGIEKLTALTTLNLGKNEISDISPLNTLSTLKVLKLNDNNNLGEHIATVLSGKTGIQSLDLSRIGLKDISFISSMTGLKELEMSNGSYNSLSSIESLTGLIKLDVSNNQSIRTLNSILNLTNLEVLNISNTGISKIELDAEREIGIYNLTKLKELYISGLDIQDITCVAKTQFIEQHHKNENGDWEGKDVARLNDIEVLDISYINRNGNSSIPYFAELKNFEKLQKLYMQGNNLYDVNGIYELPKLSEVNLENNKISDLSGLLYTEDVTDEETGISHKVIRDYCKAVSIDLSGNEIKEYDEIGNLPNRSSITFLDLSENHIYKTSPVEGMKATLKLQNQHFETGIYKKNIKDLNQYIFLCGIIYNAKNPDSVIYDKNAKFEFKGCSLNSDSNYQSVNALNAIIDTSKVENLEQQEEITFTLSGGIADGSKIKYNITDSPSDGLDSILCKDNNLANKIYNKLSSIMTKNDDHRYLYKNGLIINAYHDVITQIDEFDVSNSNITDLTGMENLDGLRDFNVSKNTGLTTIDPLKYCSTIEILNASETSIANNISAVEDMNNLKVLLLNNVKLSNVGAINNLTNKKLENQEYNTLTEIDLSANQLSSIDGLENIDSLQKLSVTKNNLTSLPDLSKLNNLERLTAYSNKIDKMPVIGTTDTLRYIFLSDNKITDISELKKLSTIIELDLSNNLLYDDDIDNIKDVRITRILKLAGNYITDISKLRTSIASVNELDISKNMIQDVSVVDSRFTKSGTLTANNQKIAWVLTDASTSNNQKTLSIELPQIFKATKDSSSLFYTSSDFELNKCTISDSKVVINVDEVKNSNATVKIVGGKANDTVLTIVPPIDVQVSYKPDTWTNQNVVASINFTNRDNVKINNNDGNAQYLFEKNGDFTFEYVDDYGVTGETKVEVTWIDKEKPKVTGVENSKTYATSVIPIITDNVKVEKNTISKDGGTENEFTSGTEIKELGNYKLIAKDTAGNETEIIFTIKEAGLDELKSDIYKIDNNNKTISKVETGTDLSSFKSKIEGNFTVKDKNGKTLTDTQKLVTGCILSTENGDYNIVVLGDLNGTGEIELNDLAQAQKIFIELVKGDNLKTLAADINGNNKIDLNDLAKLQKLFVGIK